MRDKKNGKRRALSTVVASATALSLLLSGLFHSPAELLREKDVAAPVAIVELLSPDTDSGDGSEQPEERRSSLRARLRQAWLRLPRGVRAMVGVPLWGLGWVLWQAAGALWNVALSPLAGTALGTLGATALLLLALLGAVKAAFPELPLKKLLNRRTLLILLLGTVCLAGVDLALQLSGGEDMTLRELLRSLGSLLLLTAAGVSALRVQSRKKGVASAKRPTP